MAGVDLYRRISQKQMFSAQRISFSEQNTTFKRYKTKRHVPGKSDQSRSFLILIAPSNKWMHLNIIMKRTTKRSVAGVGDIYLVLELNP